MFRRVCFVQIVVGLVLALLISGPVAIAYLLHKTPYVFPVVGGRKIEHLEANLDALRISLTPEQIKDLEGVVPFDPGFPNWMIVSVRWPFVCLHLHLRLLGGRIFSPYVDAYGNICGTRAETYANCTISCLDLIVFCTKNKYMYPIFCERMNDNVTINFNCIDPKTEHDLTLRHVSLPPFLMS